MQPGVGETGPRLVAQRREIGLRRQPQAIGGIEERALGQKPAVREILEEHDHPRPEPEAAGRRVRLDQQLVAQAEVLRAEAQHVAALEPEAVDEDALGHQPRQPVAGGERRRQAPAAGELDPPVERIGPVDRLDLHQRALRLAAPIGEGRHGAEIDETRYLGGLLRHPVPLGLVGEAIGELDLRITAEDRSGLPAQTLLDRHPHAADRGDRGHPEREAGKEDAEPRQPAAQFAQGQAQRDRKCHSAASA